MAYITADDWVLQYNPKTLGDLCSISGSSVSDLSASAQALFYLEAASGELAAACLVAELYTTDDLTEIAATAGPSQAHLKRVVGQIALRLAMESRPEKYGGQVEKLREICDATLEQLRQGKRLFVVPSRPTWQAEGGTPEVSGMSAAKILNRNSLADRVRNFFPSTAQRQPRDRQYPY